MGRDILDVTNNIMGKVQISNKLTRISDIVDPKTKMVVKRVIKYPDGRTEEIDVTEINKTEKENKG